MLLEDEGVVDLLLDELLRTVERLLESVLERLLLSNVLLLADEEALH